MQVAVCRFFSSFVTGHCRGSPQAGTDAFRASSSVIQCQRSADQQGRESSGQQGAEAAAHTYGRGGAGSADDREPGQAQEQGQGTRTGQGEARQRGRSCPSVWGDFVQFARIVSANTRGAPVQRCLGWPDRHAIFTKSSGSHGMPTTTVWQLGIVVCCARVSRLSEECCARVPMLLVPGVCIVQVLRLSLPKQSNSHLGVSLIFLRDEEVDSAGS